MFFGDWIVFPILHRHWLHLVDLELSVTSMHLPEARLDLENICQVMGGQAAHQPRQHL